MADKRIVDLNPIVSQSGTDIYEMSDSAGSLPSKKETRTQMLAYSAANIAGNPYAVGDLLYASTTSTIGKISDTVTGNALISGGVGASPTYGKIGLTTHVSGILPGSNGGTGVNNGSSTLTYANNVQFSGNYTFNANLTGNTNVTFPTAGTLATTSEVSDLVSSGAMVRISVDSEGGLDAPNRGNSGAPYKTLSYALAAIVAAGDAAFDHQYTLDCYGDFTESNFGWIPNISYDFNNGSLTVTNQTLPDAAWGGVQGVVTIKNLKRADFQGGIYFDFSSFGVAPLSINLNFENCEFDCNQLFYFQGATNNPSSLRINGMYAVNNTPSIQIKDFAYQLIDVYCNNYFHQHVANNNAAICDLLGLRASGSFEVQNYAASGIALTMLGCSVNTPIFNGQGVGTLFVKSFGNYFNGPATLQVGSSNPSYLNFVGDVLQNSPVLLGGATYTPVSIADSIKANITPDSYTAANTSVAGNLSGINTALKHTYQWAQMLTGDVTLSQSMVGYCIQSDDLAQHTISLQVNSTISSDAMLQIIARGNYAVIISIPPGVVVNNQGGGTITIPAAGANQANLAMLRRLDTNTYSLLIAPVSPADFFQVSNSFSELLSYPDLARGNLGLPSNILTLDQNQDDIVSNPCPQIIYVNKTVADFNIDLPAFNTIDSPLAGGLLGGNSIAIDASSQCASQFVRDSLGTTILQINAGDTWILTPVGYTLSQDTGWVARKVNGSGSGQDMQETYNSGSTIAMNEGQPIVITAGEVTPGQGINFISQYSPAYQPAPPSSWMIGMSFTMNKDGFISALGYNKNVFPSGTREVGLWEYLTSSTGNLLASANVATTDPLDSATGNFYMHAITPVAVSNGARYVIAELNPTTDQYLFYSTYNPSFAVADGQSVYGFASGVLAYPTISDFPFDNAAMKGNATLEFQPATGYSSKLSISDKTSSIYLNEIETSAQVTQPFGIGTTAQRDAIPTGDLKDGAMWNNTTSGSVDRWNGASSVWNPVSVGIIQVTGSTYSLKENADHFNYYTGGQLVATLPATAPIGAIIKITGSQGTGWRINVSGSQSIIVGGSVTSASGNIQSGNISACIELICTVTDVTWTAKNQSGTITVA